MGAGAADSEAENGNGVDENSGSNKSENSESVSGQENGLPELGGLGTENELQEAEIKENDVRNKLDNPDFSENKSPSELDGTPLEHAHSTT